MGGEKAAGVCLQRLLKIQHMLAGHDGVIHRPLHIRGTGDLGQVGVAHAPGAGDPVFRFAGPLQDHAP